MFNALSYTYIIKGCDMLTSVKTFKNDSNKIEVLLLAYDENSDPEEVINYFENWEIGENWEIAINGNSLKPKYSFEKSVSET